MGELKGAIILCAGSATRANLGFNKVLYPLGQKNVLETVLDKFDNFDRIVVVAAKEDFDIIRETVCRHAGATIPIGSPKPTSGESAAHKYSVVLGGATRSDSVRAGLQAAHGCHIVAIHDAARPFVCADTIMRTIEAAQTHGSGIAAVKVTDSIKEAENGAILGSLNRSRLYAVQTPQTFRYDEISDAYRRIEGSYDDDSEVYRLAGYTPMLVDGDYQNKKLTTPGDFLNCAPNQYIGTGFDTHELIKGRKLVLGGIEIPFELGLKGHSDADVLLHAVTDALLSAAGLPDIGALFPDTDSRFKDIDSVILLKEAIQRLREKGLRVNFISAVIIAQKPKMAPHIETMRRNIAKNLGMTAEKINISATTTEFLGIIGKGGAIAASAVCLCSQENLSQK